MKFQRKKVAIALGVGGVALVAGGSVVAQDIRVNVTGTNIKRVDSETAAPIETITREDIRASGLQTINEVVRQITANNNGSIAPAFSNGFSAGGSAVSLRGLGPNNTLVLVNGRRMANYGLADDGHASYVDLSQIPFDAVERIEVLKDGASAIYGSDAVAGVVNVILRQQFSGITATATAGTNYQGDGTQYKGAITAGIGDLTKDRYNVFVSIDAQKQEALGYVDRRDYIGTSDLRYMGLTDLRFGNGAVSSNSLYGNVRPVDPNNPAVNRGPLQALPSPGCAPENVSGQFCLYDQKQFWDLTPEVERVNVYARGAYNFTEHIQGYAELSWFHVKSDNNWTPASMRGTPYNPSTQSTVNYLNTNLPVGHPDNPFNADGNAARIFIQDAFGVGPRLNTNETNTQRYLAGVKGDYAGWDWDVAGLYIKSDTDITRKGFFNIKNLYAALKGEGGFGYYRIGANAGLNNPGIYGFVAPELSYTAASEMTVFDAKASRDIYKLQGGQLALAVGYEFRREEVNYPGVPGTDTANILGIGYSAAFGSRNINALYAELYAPVLKNLELTAAIRYDDYSDFGSTWNPKVGVKWTALPSLVLRGTWATAFRAPGLYETSTANASAGTTSVVDPVRCPITGAPADCSAAILSINTGNPYIQPEKSDTWTVGVIWEPVPGLSGSLDYWNIETKDQITLGSAQAVVNNPSAFPSATLYRDPATALPGVPNSGQLVYVQTPYQNANKVKTDGIDLDIVWRWNLKDYGILTTEYQWTHIFDYSQTLSNGITQSYAGTLGNYDVSSGGGTPQDRMNLIIGWNKGPWNVTGTVRYISDYQEIPYEGVPVPDECLSVNSGPECHVSSFTTLDLSASYKGFKNWEIFGSIINVFNRIAPFSPAAAYGFAGSNPNFNYNYAYSGGTGTVFNLGARYTFQ